MDMTQEGLTQQMAEAADLVEREDCCEREQPVRIVCPTRLLHPDAKVPTCGDAFAAGHDICCVAGTIGLDPEVWAEGNFGNELIAWREMERRGGISLMPGQGFLFRTGIAQAIPSGYVMLLWDRSGMGAIKQVHRLAGVIDPSYRGEIMVRLVNMSQQIVRINVGDKIVQGIYQRRVRAECPVVDQLPATDRGSAGFGSTGR